MVKGLGDFTKKKVKVGRKVPRANESKIKVKAKKIHVPLQSTMVAEGNKDDREILTKIIKQLHHYSEPHRVQALQESKTFLASCAAPDSHIAQLFPEMMALLFKEDHETRDALVESIAYSMQRLKAESFVPVMSLLVSYLCSGLTHVNKSIRRDSLQILLVILEKGAWLVADQMDQLLQHIIMILQDRTLPLLLNTASSSSADHKQSSSGKKVKLSMFQLTLKVIRSLVHVQKISSSEQAAADGCLLHCHPLQSNTTESFGLVMLRGRQLMSNVSTKTTTIISLDMRMKFLERLAQIWRDMSTTEDNLLALNIIEALREIAKVILVLIKMPLVDASQLPAVHQRLVETLFEGFPFVCKETVVACPGSAMEIQSKLQAGMLNIEVCEIAFHHIMSRGLESSTQLIYEQVRQHMMEVLRDSLQQLCQQSANDFHSEIAQKIFSCSSLFTYEHAESLAMLQMFMSHVGEFLVQLQTSGNTNIPRSVLSAAVRSLSELSVHTAGHCRSQQQQPRHAKPLFLSMLHVLSHTIEVVVKFNLMASTLLSTFVDALKQVLQHVRNELQEDESHNSNNLLGNKEDIQIAQTLFSKCTKLLSRSSLTGSSTALTYNYLQLATPQRHHILSLLSLLPNDHFATSLRDLLDTTTDTVVNDDDVTVLLDLLGYRVAECDVLTWIDFSLQFLNGYFEKCSKLDGTLEVAILRAQGMSFRVADFVVSNSACVELNQSQAIVHKALLGWEKALHPISEKQKSVQFWIVLNGLLVFARRFLACHYLYPAITSDEQLAVANWEDLFIACFQVFARVTSELDDLQNHEQTMITIQLFVDFLGSEYLYAKRTQMFFDLLQSLLKLFQTKKLQPSDILHYVPLIRLILHRIILQSSSADVFKYQSALNVWLNLLKQQHFSRDEDNLFYERLHVDLISCF